MAPKTEKKQESEKEQLLTIWFFSLLLVPMVFWYLSGIDRTPTGAGAFWAVNVAIPMVLAGIIQLFSNLLKKRRPLLSINQQFLVLATGLIAIITLFSFLGVQS